MWLKLAHYYRHGSRLNARKNRSIASNPFMFTFGECQRYSNAGQTASLSCKLPSESDGTSVPHVNPGQTSTAAPVSCIRPTTCLVRASPGEDLQALKQKLETAHLPPVLHSCGACRQDSDPETNWNCLLGLGAAVGVIVGVIHCWSDPHSSVSDHLKEFGTLKAMGASDWVIYGVIIEQALWMAILLSSWHGSLFGVGAWTRMPPGHHDPNHASNCNRVLGITVLMCVGSAIFCDSKGYPRRPSDRILRC